MRRAIGSPPPLREVQWYTQYRLNRRCIQCLLLCHVRKNPWQPACQHAFASSRGANQQQVMPARSCYFDGPFGGALAFYIGHVRFVRSCQIGFPLRNRWNLILTGQIRRNIQQIACRSGFDVGQ